MKKSEHVGFRANPTEDKDILDDLKRYTNRTERLKYVYRKVLEMEAMPFQSASSEVIQSGPRVPAVASSTVHTVHYAPQNVAVPVERTEPLQWTVPSPIQEESLDWRKNFPEQVNPASEDTPNVDDTQTKVLKNNILSGF